MGVRNPAQFSSDFEDFAPYQQRRQRQATKLFHNLTTIRGGFDLVIGLNVLRFVIEPSALEGPSRDLRRAKHRPT